MVTIRFYANNTLGNEGYAEVSIFKDIDDPEIFIIEPSQNEKFIEDAPNYEIFITEPNLESIWYTIDNGITNYSITQQIGTINQTAWDDSSFGDITIEFWAKDLAGNIGHSEIIVEKVEKEEPSISSYPLLLIICIISLTVILSLKKNYKS